MRRTVILGTVSFAVLAGTVTGGAAQDLASDSDRVVTLGEVVVNARRTGELARDVPLSVMVLTAEDLRRTDTTSLSDVLRFDPSLSKFDGPQGRFSQLSIRGVGSLTPGGYEDGSVSAYVDGVPVPFHLIDGIYNDAAQIEVLHGPQGTLFGKDAQAGALNVVTTRPDDAERGRLSLGYGSRGYGRLTASASRALIPGTLWGRGFVDIENRGGRVEQVARGEGPGDIRNAFLRGALLYKDAGGEALLSFSHDRRRNDDVDFTSASAPRVSTYPQDTREDRDTSVIALNIRRDLANGLTFHSITGYHHSSWRYLFGVSPTMWTWSDDRETSLTQEFRLSGGGEGGLAWHAGIFAQRWDYDLDNIVRGGNSFDDTGKQTATTLAVFGEVNLPLAQGLDLTLGLRHARDRREVDEVIVHHLYGRDFVYQDQADFTGTTGRVALRYRWDDNMVWASVARGYKPGGFQTNHANGIVGIDLPSDGFDSSTSLAWELGYKRDYGRLGLSATLFRTDTSDEQIPEINMTTYRSFYLNEDTRSTGAELALTWQATDALRIGGALAFVDATMVSGSYNGNRLPNAPKTRLHGFAEYRGADWFLRGDVTHTGDRRTDLANATSIRGSTVADLRIGKTIGGAEWVLAVENLLDEDYLVYGNYGLVFPGEERHLSLTANWTF